VNELLPGALMAESIGLSSADLLTSEMIADVFAQFDRGELPELPIESGFKVVIDRRPSGHENDYLSADEFAAYASRREIAVAAPGTRLYNHDCGHVVVDMLMLRSASVADLVCRASSNALATGRAEEFIAFDTLGDNMSLANTVGPTQSSG